MEGEGAFEFGGFLGRHFGKIGVQVELVINSDNASVRLQDGDTWRFTGTSISVPIIAKYDINLGQLVIQPLVGAYFNIGLDKLKGKYESARGVSDSGETPWALAPTGLVFGGDLGWRFNSGLLFTGARYNMDLGNTVIAHFDAEEKLWKKSALTILAGYEFN
jgi:hypothetical protein